ncbi:MAG: RNA polymerase sigma factor [Candidatus Glassbacteria bacterium]|nr:RNA polymerase sigma factor [Candidatus Glassbacteria bacterium]
MVRLYQKPLYSFIVRMVENRATAEDIFQETWVRVIRHIGSFRGDARFSTWLFQIALNQCRNAMRSLGRRSFVSLEDAGEFPVEPEMDADRILIAGRVRKFLASLPVKMREVLVLRYYHDKSEQEIAAVIGVPVGTVKSRLHRATNMLREKMESFQTGSPAM